MIALKMVNEWKAIANVLANKPGNLMMILMCSRGGRFLRDRFVRK